MLVALIGTALLLAGCSADGVGLPPGGSRFDYQLGGGYPPAAGVELVVRDREDVP